MALTRAKTPGLNWWSFIRQVRDENGQIWCLGCGKEIDMPDLHWAKPYVYKRMGEQLVGLVHNVGCAGTVDFEISEWKACFP